MTTRSASSGAGKREVATICGGRQEEVAVRTSAQRVGSLTTARAPMLFERRHIDLHRVTSTSCSAQSDQADQADQAD